MSKQTDLINIPDAITVDGSNNVGIGTSSPSKKLHVYNTAATDASMIESTQSFSTLAFKSSTNSSTATFGIDGAGNASMENKLSSGSATFVTNGSQRMKIDSSGNVLVANTTGSSSDTGHIFAPTGIAFHVRDGGIPLVVDRLSNEGDLQLFRKDGTTVGSISYFSHGFQLQGESGHSGISFAGNSWIPLDDGTRTDDLISLGLSSYRFDDAYITNGVTTGSDENDKNSIAVLTDTEMLVAARLSQTFRTYKWNKAVALKGDNARTHTGTIAQEVQAAFTAEGLDAGDYAMFMSNTWWEHDVDVPAVEAVAEVTDEDGNVTTEAVEAVDAYTRTDTYDTEAEAPEGATSKTRLGIRYPELLSFVAAYNEQRFASIEARLTALEA